MLTALSYVGAHWFLILSVILGTAGLAAFAWFTKNWKAALAAIVLVFAGLAYQSADLGGYKRRIDEERAQEISTLKGRLATVSFITAFDTKRALDDADLNTKLETLAFDTPPNAGPCLDAAAAHRVWAIRNLANGLSAPLPSRRYPKLLQRLSGKP